MKRRRLYLRRRERADKRQRTGLLGVSFLVSACNRRDGTVQQYFVANIKSAEGKPLKRRHCISTLGRAEAWRRAVRDRAAYEARLTAERSAS